MQRETEVLNRPGFKFLCLSFCSWKSLERNLRVFEFSSPHRTETESEIDFSVIDYKHSSRCTPSLRGEKDLRTGPLSDHYTEWLLENRGWPQCLEEWERQAIYHLFTSCNLDSLMTFYKIEAPVGLKSHNHVKYSSWSWSSNFLRLQTHYFGYVCLILSFLLSASSTKRAKPTMLHCCQLAVLNNSCKSNEWS